MRFEHPSLTMFLVMCTNFSKIYGIFNNQEFDRRLKALQKVVDYMVRRPEQMNIDAIFGLTLAEAHVMSILSHTNARFLQLDQQNTLRNLVKICDDARRLMKKNAKIESKFEAILNEKLNDPEPWIHPILWKKDLLKTTTLKKLNNTYGTVLKLLYNGTPKEEESDYCIASMLKGFPKETCQVTEECEIMLLRDDDPRGYAITHRLLLVWFAIAFHCEELEIVPYAKLIPKYCSLILQNLVDIESLGFPPPTPDLIMEEVIVCGAEGYLEFTNDHLANKILSWQHPEGCFDSFITKNKSGLRSRRASSKIDFGCDNHATGLGAASIALLIRQYIETATYI